MELKLATRLKVTLGTLWSVPVVVDIMAMSPVAGKCYMKMPTLIQRIIVP